LLDGAGSFDVAMDGATSAVCRPGALSSLDVEIGKVCGVVAASTFDAVESFVPLNSDTAGDPSDTAGDPDDVGVVLALGCGASQLVWQVSLHAATGHERHPNKSKES